MAKHAKVQNIFIYIAGAFECPNTLNTLRKAAIATMQLVHCESAMRRTT
jgi:hypothetical protein